MMFFIIRGFSKVLNCYVYYNCEHDDYYDGFCSKMNNCCIFSDDDLWILDCKFFWSEVADLDIVHLSKVPIYCSDTAFAILKPERLV